LHGPVSAPFPRQDYLRGVGKTLVRYGARRAQRRALGELDDRLLADIGLSRTDAVAEARKPFWR